MFGVYNPGIYPRPGITNDKKPSITLTYGVTEWPDPILDNTTETKNCAKQIPLQASPMPNPHKEVGPVIGDGTVNQPHHRYYDFKGTEDPFMATSHPRISDQSN
ncbi:hypothetical protein AVEN_12597-1 [Araneus ventricosus]|uniref:Uncharacterized protein n=1 Tax=Araneus ventricosus TaxID=182803 RepID=A0A4Y2AAL2_ARAVE|nr:hypothetical protein AVEN_12597-1 [Araneus ventricosus]